MADYIVTDDRACIPLGDDVTLEQGATFFVNPLTALGMVDRCKKLGAKAVIITAAASQIGRMIIQLCKKEGIIPICTVRREEQAKFLMDQLKVKHVVNTSKDDWLKSLGKICMKLRPTACLECISGDMTGLMCQFLGLGGTVILYGLLSEEPAGNINTINFLARG